MANKNKEKYNKYMADYMLKRYHRLRGEAVKKLGGVCVKCGTKDNLEIDHIDHKKKEISIGKLWSITKDKFNEELAKCQLLCKTCHQDKTTLERGKKIARDTHGTLSSYKHCRCDECKAAKAAYQREHKRKRVGSSTG